MFQLKALAKKASPQKHLLEMDTGQVKFHQMDLSQFYQMDQSQFHQMDMIIILCVFMQKTCGYKMLIDLWNFLPKYLACNGILFVSAKPVPFRNKWIFRMGTVLLHTVTTTKLQVSVSSFMLNGFHVSLNNT